ncbi:hypothetical protein HYS91_04620 [Candidatus Daviesbacteria bacterium]|nr:hypothetical protein [Candidatus Daviesbacteria bacterium]
MLALFLSIITQRKFFLVALIVFVVYILIYLAAVGHLIFTSRMEPAYSFLEVKFLTNWQQLLLRQRSPFLFEAIGAIYIGPNIKLFLSIPNLILASVLGFLVGSNFALSYYNFKRLGLSGGKGAVALLGTIPAIVSGSVCCVPTLILVLGLQLTATLATAWSFFIPLSIILLILSLVWSVKRIETGRL